MQNKYYKQALHTFAASRTHHPTLLKDFMVNDLP